MLFVVHARFCEVYRYRISDDSYNSCDYVFGLFIRSVVVVGIPCGYLVGCISWGRKQFVLNFEEILTVKTYSVRLWVLGCLLGLVTGVVDYFNAKIVVPADVYWGLVFLVSLFWALRYYVDRSQVANPNQWIRRAMISSMIRLMGVLTFLLISVLRQGKANVVFVIAFGLYFILFLSFEMSEKRINLRPDSNDGPSKENA